MLNRLQYRRIDVVGAVLSVLGMGGIVLGILIWQEGGEAVGALSIAIPTARFDEAMQRRAMDLLERTSGLLETA